MPVPGAGWRELLLFLRVMLALVWPTALLSEGLSQERHQCLATNPRIDPEVSVSACANLLSDAGLSVLDRAEALARRGIAYRELSEFDLSIQDLGASVALDADASVMRMLAWSYREAGRAEDADAVYTQVLEIDQHWQGWLSRCVVRQDMQKYEEALPDCQNALEQDDENLDSLYFTARALSFLDRPSEALPLTERAISQAPDDPRHLVEHLWALHQLGRTRVARRLLADGLKRFPDHAGLIEFDIETR